MNKNLDLLMGARNFFISLCFILLLLNCHAQKNSTDSGFDKILNNSYAGNWKYFLSKDTITGTVLVHHQQFIQCGDMATASVTIIKTEQDTARVIDICNTKNYKAGQKVAIFHSAVPSFSVCIPFYDKIDAKTKEVIYWLGEYDTVVLKTTWGLVRPSE